MPDLFMKRNPQNAPPTMKSADGSTTLVRFTVEAVIYAPDQSIAQARLDEDLYLDAARIKPGHGPTGPTAPRTCEECGGVYAQHKPDCSWGRQLDRLAI